MRSRWAVVWALCGVVALVQTLVWGGLGSAVIATGSSVLSTVVTLFGVLSVWAWRRGSRRGRSRTEQLTEAQEALALMVTRQWRDEARLRQLFDVAPLPVLWSDARPAGLGAVPRSIGGTVVCRADRLDEPAAVFRRLDRRRLVVLGGAGSGKSTFAVVLALSLLENREPGEPVPVLLSAASFDPRGGVRDWLRRRIAAEYPALTDADAYGPSAIEDLLTGHRVLPVIDGLDELPPAARTKALEALNDTYDTFAPLVVTCRTEAYVAAVPAAGPLAGAAVVEPAPVDAVEAVELLRAARPSSWDGVADAVARDPRGPLAEALTSPLMVALARTVYADAAADPAELRGCRTRQAVEDHLLDALVPAVYARARRQDPGADRPWSPESAHRHLAYLAAAMERGRVYDLAWWRLHGWVPPLSRTWARAALWTCVLLGLTLLGYAVSGGVPGLPARDRDAAFGYALGVAVALPCVCGVAAWWAGRRDAAGAHGAPGIVLTAACGGAAFAVPDVALGRVDQEPHWYVVGCVAVVGFAFLLVFRTAGLPVPPRLPSRGALTTRHWRQRLPRAVAVFAGTTVLTGAALRLYALVVLERGASSGAPGAPGAPGQPAAELPWSSGLTMGAVLGAVQAVLHWVRSTTSTDDPITPASAVRADRLVTLVGAGLGALVVTLPLAIVAVLRAGSPAGGRGAADVLVTVVVLLLGMGPTGLVLALAASSWPHYTVARLVPAARGRLPWRLQAFLADAHRLGVLRQTGPVYQFRHARLQQRMARHGTPPRQRTAAERSAVPFHR
ncbi:NACHT domain-containing protein [Streptomyces ficellus]|uniref:NACHT domain-containing protein n=1 Tax=Streptomyces ficellus TaxID=1977088 RepID=A0A6I6EZU9_9ACTN|nr:NACHT domain-containing protein [Streptomyces ficellus]QGV77183.1 NACHT domain-containing protein [Streptomyces ficellus]